MTTLKQKLDSDRDRIVEFNKQYNTMYGEDKVVLDYEQLERLIEHTQDGVLFLMSRDANDLLNELRRERWSKQ